MDDFNRPSLGPNWAAGITLYPLPTLANNEAVCAASTTCAATWNQTSTQTGIYACAKVDWTTGDTSSYAGACIASITDQDLVCCGLNQGWVTMQVMDNGTALTEQVRASVSSSTGTYVGIARTSATDFQCFTSPDGKTWQNRGTVQTVQNINAASNRPALFLVNQNKTLDLWEGGTGGLPSARSCGAP